MSHDQKVLEIFIESCLEQLDNIEQNVLDLEKSSSGQVGEKIGLVFRAAHSIKGDAASLGLQNLSNLCHHIENLLQNVRDGKLTISGNVVSILLQGFDLLKNTIKSPDLGQTKNFSPYIADLEACTSNCCIQEQNPAEEAKQDGADAADNKQEENSISRLTIPAEQLDLLVDRVGQLAIAQARLHRLAREKSGHAFLPLAEEFEALCNLLRTQVLDMRMLPLQVSFAKYRRLVRDLSTQLGKEADFVMEGHNTELDKTLIEELNTPLIHLLRNCVDHGIETTDVRRGMGKPLQGKIILRAQQIGGEVHIELHDDGGGIDTAKLKQRAVERELIDPDAEMSEEELLDLIFLPGLSTADSIGHVSGRGVGMDAVRESIQALRGKIDVRSKPGHWTEFHIQLPITMAIIDCLRIVVADSEFFLHLDYVEECLEMERKSSREGPPQRHLNLRGKALPLIDLRDFFAYGGQRPAVAHIVVVRTNGELYGIVADEVVGQHQAVLKQLGPALSHVEGILGATVTEMGNMGLILDIPGLTKSALAEAKQETRTTEQERRAHGSP